MAVRIPWDEEETALLIDTYLRVEAGQLPLKEAVATLSRQLRQRAKQSGVEIDDVFRNENGIRMRLAEIQYLMTGGISGFKNTSILYKNMAHLCITDMEQFQKILEKAKKGIKINEFSKDSFVNWLSDQVAEEKLSKIETALSDVNDYAIKKKILPGQLFEVTEPSHIARLRLSITMNWWLRTVQRAKHTAMMEACDYYERYLLHIQKEAEERLKIVSTSKLTIEANNELSATKGQEETEPISASEITLLEESQNESPLPDDTYGKPSNDTIAGYHTTSSAEKVVSIHSGSAEMVPEKDQENCASIKKAEEKEIHIDRKKESDLVFVDFTDSMNSYAYTKPVYVEYFHERHEVENWTKMYVQVLACLFEDYPSKILQLSGRSLSGDGRMWLGYESHSSQMARPVKFAEDMYAEANLSASDIVQRVRQLLEYCLVDVEHLIVAYRRVQLDTDEITTQQSVSQSDEISANRKQGFLAWLQNQGYPINTSRAYLSAIRFAERHAAKLKLLPWQLLAVTNFDEAVAIQKALFRDSEFNKINERQNNRLNIVLTHYLNCLRSEFAVMPKQTSLNTAESVKTPPANGITDLENKASKGDPLHLLLQNAGLEFIDNRQNGGNLWIVGGYELKPVIDQLRKMTLYFRFREEGGRRTGGKPAWWTRDTLPKDAKALTPLIVPESSQVSVPCPKTDSITKELSNVSKLALKQPAQPNTNNPFSEVLAKHFANGIRPDSIIDINRFRLQWQKSYGTELTESNLAIKTKLYQSGVVHNGVVYHLDNILSPKKRSMLIELIHRWMVEEHKIPVYYEALYQAFSEHLLDEKITGPGMLRSCLEAINPGYYRLEEKYLSLGDQKLGQKIDDHAPDVIKYLSDQGRPMKIEEIHQGMPHLTQELIRNTLRGESCIINSGANEYFYIGILDFNKAKLDEIAHTIQIEIDENHYISGSELVVLLRERLPHIMDPYSHISETGIRKALGVWLSDKFSFNGNLVSALGKELSISDVYAHFCQKHRRFTLQDLYALRDSIGQNPSIYFDVVYDNTLRISEEQFVAKDMARFDIDGTDAAIDLFCPDDYISIEAITSFSAFPDAGYLWNMYLLEHYVYAYSSRYRLVHNGFRASQVKGAIVKKESPYIELRDVLVHDLATSKVALQRDDALDYFVQKGYIARMRLADIEGILSAANGMRSMKG